MSSSQNLVNSVFLLWALFLYYTWGSQQKGRFIEVESTGPLHSVEVLWLTLLQELSQHVLCGLFSLHLTIAFKPVSYNWKVFWARDGLRQQLSFIRTRHVFSGLFCKRAVGRARCTFPVTCRWWVALLQVTARVRCCPYLLLKGLCQFSPRVDDGLEICKDLLRSLSDRWWKRHCHADLLGASREADTGFHCGQLREHFPLVGPSPLSAGKYSWLHGEIKVVLQYAISNLVGFFLRSVDQVYSFLKMFWCFLRGKLFSC